MKTHELKTWPVYFAAIIDGSKTFEVRKNDRVFSVGDTLHLREWSHGRWERDGMRIVARSVDTPDYTGREVRRRVTYVLEGPAFGIAEGYCVLGLAPDSSREDAIDREWSLRFIALCEAAGVDPATLEDGPEALHDAIVRMRAEVEQQRVALGGAARRRERGEGEVSQARCDKCGHLYSANLTYVGEVCGVRLSGTEWCRGKIVEHECGGPREACGLRGCEECDNRTALRAALEKSRAEVAKLRAIVAELWSGPKVVPHA